MRFFPIYIPGEYEEKTFNYIGGHPFFAPNLCCIERHVLVINKGELLDPKEIEGVGEIE